VVLAAHQALARQVALDVQGPGGAGARDRAGDLVRDDGRTQHAGGAAQRVGEGVAAAGTVGVGHEHDADVVDHRPRGVGGEAPAHRAQRLLGRHERRDLLRHRPAGLAGQRLELGALGRGRAAQALDQGVLAGLAGAGGQRLFVGVARHRRGGELLDVGEQGLGQPEDRVGLEAVVVARGRDAPPQDPRADAVGALQRVHRAPVTVLDPPELEVHRGVGQRRVGAQQVEELVERDGDAEPDPAAELAVHRQRVLGDLGTHGRDDLVAGVEHHGPQAVPGRLRHLGPRVPPRRVGRLAHAVVHGVQCRRIARNRQDPAAAARVTVAHVTRAGTGARTGR